MTANDGMQPHKEPGDEKAMGFFSIFPVLGRLLFTYAKRLFSVETIANLEKRQGVGSGERQPEEVELDRRLERNPHNMMIDANPHIPQPPSIRETQIECNGVKFVLNKDADRDRTAGK